MPSDNLEDITLEQANYQFSNSQETIASSLINDAHTIKGYEPFAGLAVVLVVGALAVYVPKIFKKIKEGIEKINYRIN